MKNKLLLLIFLFHITQNWSQNPVPFYPTVDATGYSFGSVVDVDGDEIISATQSNLPITTPTGKVYLFRFNGSTLEQEQVFYPDEVTPFDAFGYSISIQNNFIAVGTPGHDSSASDSGAVYIYQKINSEYQFLQKVTAYDGETNDYFGNKVKLYNTTLFIAANGEEPNGFDINFGYGAVYVYNFDGTSWVFTEKLTVPNSNAFGYKIDVENETLVISSDQTPNNIHTFHWDSTHWAYSSSFGFPTTDDFIYDFSLSNNQLFAIVAHPSQDETVSVFENDNGNWTNTVSLTPISGTQVLTCIEVNGDNMFLGSERDDSQLNLHFPVQYFRKNGTNWEYQSNLYSTAPTNQVDGFGFSIASNGNIVAIGSPYEATPFATGKAYYLDTTLGTSNFEQKMSNLFPNPTYDIVSVQNNSTTEIVKTEVYSVTGKLLLSEINNINKISLEKFSQGLYFVKLYYQNTQVETFKIIRN